MFALAGTALGGNAAVVVFQEGDSNDFVANYSGTSDTALASNASNANGGGLNYFSAGRNGSRRSLLRFDLSSLSGEVSSVEAAEITLSLGSNATSANVTIAVYQLSDANAGWTEGTGVLTGDAALGDATWGHRIYSSAAWAGSAGARTAGTDFVSTPIASFVWTPGSTEVTFSVPVAVLQDWIANPSLNAGLIFAATDSTANSIAANFASSENANLALRPLLSIEYTAIPEPQSVALMAAAGLLICFVHRRRNFLRA